MITAVVFIATAYVLYERTKTSDFQFNLCEREARKNSAFDTIEFHQIPRNQRGVDYIRGKVATDEDYIKLKRLTEKYDVYGIEEIEILSRKKEINNNSEQDN